MSLTILAQKEIKREFPTGTLGVTTRTEAIQNMLATGASIIEFSDSIVTFEGTFPTQECTMNVCRVMFLDNKIFSIMLSDTAGMQHPENYAKLEKGVKADYGQTGKDGMEDLMIGLMILQMKSQADSTAEMDIWSRVDEKTAFLLIKGENGFGMMYLDKDAMFNTMVSKMAETLGATGPDYDEANAVKAVAGITFGGAKTDVRAQLIRKYGTPFSDKEHEIQYSRITIGGNDYDFASFYFTYNPETKRNEFVAAVFQKSYYSFQEEEASHFFDAVTGQYARKYTNESRKKENRGEKFYTYGMVDKDGYYPISVSLEKSLSKGGDMRMYIVVSYFQYKLASLYNDEI